MTLYDYDDSIRWYFKDTKFFTRNSVFGQDIMICQFSLATHNIFRLTTLTHFMCMKMIVKTDGKHYFTYEISGIR